MVHSLGDRLNLRQDLNTRRACSNQGDVKVFHRLTGQGRIPSGRMDHSALKVLPSFYIGPFPIVEDSSGGDQKVT